MSGLSIHRSVDVDNVKSELYAQPYEFVAEDSNGYRGRLNALSGSTILGISTASLDYSWPTNMVYVKRAATFSIPPDGRLKEATNFFMESYAATVGEYQEIARLDARMGEDSDLDTLRLMMGAMELPAKHRLRTIAAFVMQLGDEEGGFDKISTKLIIPRHVYDVLKTDYQEANPSLAWTPTGEPGHEPVSSGDKAVSDFESGPVLSVKIPFLAAAMHLLPPEEIRVNLKTLLSQVYN